MSSRQIKFLRQQLEAKKPKKEENLDDVDPIDLPSNDTPDLSILLSENSGDIGETGQEAPPQIDSPPPPLPPPPAKKKQKKEKRSSFDEEVEFASLVSASKKAKSEKEASKDLFSMQKLNIIRELKSIVGSSKYEECLKLPKSSASIRFIGRLHKWPASIPQYFNLIQFSTNIDGSPNFKVELTEYGKEQSSIYTALSRINDAQGILELGASSHFSPPVLPFLCQSLLFQREFESATEVVLRGLYVLQQSLPSNFVPLNSKLLPSPGRKDLLDLIAFVARFAFRRCCFETSNNLWKFGISLTDDDPVNFLLLAAVPALYANDAKFINEMLNSPTKKWHDIPIKYLPDWCLVDAILKLPEDIESLSNEIARWPFIFTDLGLTCDMQVPPFLSSLGSAFRRRVEKYFEKPELDSMLETCALVAQDIDMSEEHAVIMSYWIGVTGDDVEIGDMVEEFVMPTG